MTNIDYIRNYATSIPHRRNLRKWLGMSHQVICKALRVDSFDLIHISQLMNKGIIPKPRKMHVDVNTVKFKTVVRDVDLKKELLCLKKSKSKTGRMPFFDRGYNKAISDVIELI